MNLYIKMDDRASKSFAFGGCMNESLYIQENGNFNCRQCEIIVDVDQKSSKFLLCLSSDISYEEVS